EQGKALTPDRPCYVLFRQIIESRERVASTLHAMANLKVLGWLLPEFRPLMNLAPRNSIHEFTVGYHSLEVVRRLEDMGMGAAESVFQEVYSHLDYPAALLLAGLLHDAGKVVTKGPHSETGAEMAPAVGLRLDLPPHQIQKIQSLILNHLVMAEVAQFRDLTRDESIKELLKVVPDQESLDQLFLLTYADGASVGNHIWTPVQTRFLEELYHRASHMLAQPETETGQFDLRRYQRRVTQALRAHNFAPEAVARHVELMPASYLLNTPSETMALHIEMLEKVQETGMPIVEFRDDRVGHFTELIICVVEDPRPGLLSKIAGCLWASDLSVYSAQVFTRDGDPRIAIDTLWIDFHGRTLDPHHKRRLELDLIKVLSNDTPVRELLASHGKERDLNAPLREPDVAGRRSEDHIICEVHAGDQRGLLYRITRTISELGWDIHSARINGGRSRARDVFYVNERTGLSSEEAASQLRARLMAQTAAS
nr:HD domain-containing protein [Armatimonadota bacterium]